jgi:hypothetical protein
MKTNACSQFRLKKILLLVSHSSFTFGIMTNARAYRYFYFYYFFFGKKPGVLLLNSK